MSDTLKFTVEGPDSERGHVRLEQFVEHLEHLLSALNGIDRVVGNSDRAKLYYRITEATHSSPMSITLEPITVEGRHPGGDYFVKCRNRLFHEIGAIRRMAPVSEDIDRSLLEDLFDIAEGWGTDFKRATLSSNGQTADFDKQLDDNLRKVMGEVRASYGSLEGRLDALNIHGNMRRFWLYPAIGPERVMCDFPAGTSEQIRGATEQYVKVMGMKYFRPPSNFPYRIKVHTFTMSRYDNSTSLAELGGIAPNATGQMSAVEFVRHIRNEWE